MKKCKKCGIEKSLDQFSKKKSNKDGLQDQCKSCVKEYNTLYYQNNSEELKQSSKNYRKNNRKAIQIYNASYNATNSDKKNKVNSRYINQRRLNDSVFKLRMNVSNSIYKLLKLNNSSKNNNSISQYLPYTILELKEYLEKQFELWMNWENQGKYNPKTWDDNNPETWTWQIDHKIPQSKLPYSSMEDENFKKCWALENVRPYSAKQNLLDGNRR